MDSGTCCSNQTDPLIFGAQPNNGNDEMAEVMTGTTIMAIKFRDGVVLGADTRTSAGSVIVNRASRKISRVNESIFVARSGSAADTQALTGYVKHYLTQYSQELQAPPRVKAAASLFRLLAYQNKNALSAGLIVAGYDPVDGFQVYSIPLGGSLLKQSFAVGGSGSTYITGLIDATWKENMEEEEAVRFVQKSIAHAMSRDGASGGMIRHVVVTKDEVKEGVLTGDNLPF